MKKEIMYIAIANGKPAFLERGGAYFCEGKATIICDKNGKPKIPEYIQPKKDAFLHSVYQALFTLEKDDIIIETIHRGTKYEIEIKKICGFLKDGVLRIATYRTISSFKHGKWSNPSIAKKYSVAIKASREKAVCYHCKHSHYYKEKETK